MHCTLKYGTSQYTGYTAWCSAHYRLHCTVQVHSREQNITKSDKLSILSVSVKPSVESASIVSTATEGHIVLFSQVASWWNFSVLGNTFAPLYCYLCLPFKNKLYLSKLQSVFVQIAKCICSNYKMYLSNFTISAWQQFCGSLLLPLAASKGHTESERMWKGGEADKTVKHRLKLLHRIVWLIQSFCRKVLSRYVWAKLILKFTDIRIMRSEGRFPVGLKCLQSLKLFEKSLNRWNFLKSSSIIETFKKVPQSLKLLTEFSNKVFSRASHGSLHRNS